jgi:Tol biopolymer transport system component
MFPDSGFYSHFTWRNSKEVLVWCSISEKFGKIRKGSKKSNFIIEKILPVYRIIPLYLRRKVLPADYYLLKDQGKEMKKIEINYEDGHPGFSINKRYLITDTYANKKNYVKLLLYDWKKNKRIILGKFYSLPNKKYLETTKTKQDFKKWAYSNFRIDLHPRWNFQGDKVTFDSIHEGKRNCYLINLNKFIS